MLCHRSKITKQNSTQYKSFFRYKPGPFKHSNMRAHGHIEVHFNHTHWQVYCKTNIQTRTPAFTCLHPLPILKPEKTT